MNISEDLSIRKIALIEGLPARILYLCLDNSLTTIQQLLAFRHRHRNFLALRNCGNKSNSELVQVCEKYRDYFVVSDSLSCELETNVMLQKYNLLAPHQKLILNRYFNHLLSNLGSRQYNYLAAIADIHDPDAVFTKILLSDFQFVKAYNFGDISLSKLNQLTLKIDDFIEELQTIPFVQIGKEKLKWLLENFVTIKPDDFNHSVDLMFDETGKLKVFTFIKYVLDTCGVFNSTENKLFDVFYIGKNTDIPPILSIAKKIKCSKHHVLLIKVRLKSKIENTFSFLSNIPHDDFSEYDLSNDILILNDSVAKKINNKEIANFNFKLYSVIFRLLLKNTHSIFGDKKFFKEDIRHAYNRKKKNHFLINTKYCEYFDFEAFIRDIYKRLNERPRKVFSLQFKDHLLNFLSDAGKPYMESITHICKSILAAEFGFVVTPSGYLEFVSKAKKLFHHYYYEILDEKGSPMKAYEICNAVKEKYPLLNITESHIRNAISRESQLFICLGRTSTYGLRKWEQEKEGLKGGSIRFIVIQYLVSEGKPKHISDILSHVNNYRNTTSANILANLKRDSRKRFRIYKGNRISLEAKKDLAKILDQN